MFVKISIILLSALIKASRCSLVIDSLSQDALYLTDYCPTMKYCMEGTHVMCMYYNPHAKMGPRCSNPQNVSVTPDLATKLLDVSNAIRSKIALGKEKGKNGEYLPRAYGMFRLKWDNELATFAQVLANQCVLRHDLCRATKRFSDPGQTAGLVRFTVPDWYPVSRSGSFTTPGISPSKIMYAVLQTLKSWYGQKNLVTQNMLLNYPDWTQTPNNQGGRLYMEMVFASATHMGCGISAYTEYAYNENRAAFNYNSIQVICNFSARPRHGSRVFNTQRPVGSGFTIHCGCPVGSREDLDCLCNEYERVEMLRTKQTARSCPNMKNCEPTMVLLPIFTVEDAPSEKLMSKAMDIKAPLTNYIRERFDNTSIGQSHSPQSREIFDLFAETETEHSISRALNNAMNMAPSPPTPIYKSSRQLPQEPNKYTDAMNRHYDRITQIRSPAAMAKPQFYQQPTKFTANRKSSIFTRAEKFSLPIRKSIGSFDIGIKKDVAPRKDFSNVQQLVNSYLKKKRFGEDGKGKTHEDRFNKAFNFDEHTTTETTLNKAEEKVMSYNQYIKPKSNITEERKTIYNKLNDETENKLMTLLDTLEREVKHIELDGNEKEMFDAKIRKIYGTVVGKLPNLLTQKQTKLIENDLHSDVILYNELMDLTHFTDEEPMKHEANRQTNDIRRHDNHILDDERKVDTHYNEKRVNGIKNYDDLDGKRSRPTKNDEDLKVLREYKHNIMSSDEDIKTSNYAKYSESDRSYKTGGEELKRRNNEEVAKVKGFYTHKNDEHEEQLSIERRKYYQDKLENLEKRLHDARSPKHRNEHGGERAIRRMRPSRGDDMQMRLSRSKNQIDAFYMPDRARYVHGY